METKRFLKQIFCSWSSDVKSQSDFIVGSITIPFKLDELLIILYTFLGFSHGFPMVFPWFSPNVLRTLPTNLGAGAESDWKLSFSEHGRHEALVYRRRYLFSSGTTKMLGAGIPCWENDDGCGEAVKFAVEI